MDRDDWEKSLDMFYEAMGWDKEPVFPPARTLESSIWVIWPDKLAELGLIS